MKKYSNIGSHGGGGNSSNICSSRRSSRSSSSSVDELKNKVDEYVREMGRQTDLKIWTTTRGCGPRLVWVFPPDRS